MRETFKLGRKGSSIFAAGFCSASPIIFAYCILFEILMYDDDDDNDNDNGGDSGKRVKEGLIEFRDARWL
jgi:hypothetical protein